MAKNKGRCALLFLVLSFLARPALAGAQQELLVSAAASLTNAFAEAGKLFEGKNPGTKVVLNLGASGQLLHQIDNGAPVDVFASADQDTMDKAQARELLAAGTRRDFARNRLVLAVPEDSGLGIDGLRDLLRPEVKRIALGEPAIVPAGRYARQSLEAARLWAPLQPKLIPGANVRQVLDYLTRGEVDAGFVFETDALLQKGKVKVVQVVEGHHPVLYPIAVVGATRQRELAGRFIELVAGPEGRSILGRYGFQAP